MKRKLFPRLSAVIPRLSAVIFASVCLLLVTACKDDDNNASQDGDPDTLEEFVEPEAEPTADAMSVTVDGLTYVFDGSYTGEGKALVARVGNRATYLASDSDKPNEEVEHIILPNDRIADLSNAESAALVMVLAKGGSIVVATPTIDNLKTLVSRLRNVIIAYQEGGNNVSAKYVVQMLNTESLDRIVMWTDNFDFSVYLDSEGRGDYLSLAIFREEDSYLAYRETEALTDYQYGMKADQAALWMNTKEDEASLQAARWDAARMMARRAGGEAEQYVDKIAKSNDFTFDMGMQVNGPQGYSRYHACTLTYRIWTAYSKEKNCDVYCVTQTVTAFNQDLNCGPSGERKWYNGGSWEPWKQLDRQVSRLRKDVYGPYMKKLYTRCELVDAGRSVKIENYAPMNSTSGGQNVTDGFSFGLGANASVSAKGPQAGVSASCTWSHSVSRFSADLSMTASPSASGVTEWTYTAPGVESHFSKTPWKNHYHEFPRQIQVTTCTVEQAWVWTVAASESKTVTIKPTFQLQDEWLTYDRAFSHIGQAYARYINQGDSRSVTPMVVSCPPRYIQTWSMSVTTEAEGADVVKIKNYLTDQLKQYFLASSVFYTDRPDHKKAYNEGKGIEDYDEIGQFIVDAKNAFNHNDNVIEILREAGRVGGVPNTGDYTIVWRQTDAGINSDREEYTFSMKMPK